MNGDAAEEDGFAVEEDLGAAGFDGAEAYVVFELVFVWLPWRFDLVELGFG